jgi:hypothetical protein
MTDLAANSTRYTYGQYATWDDDQRWELIDGVLYDMSPAPRRSHQDLQGNLPAPPAPAIRETRTPAAIGERVGARRQRQLGDHPRPLPRRHRAQAIEHDPLRFDGRVG